MQTDAIKQSSKSAETAITLWKRFGSVGVVAALSLLCFKCAPLYWPFALLSFLGYASISFLRKTGLILSFVALSAVIYFVLPSYAGKLWLSFFLAATALSWFLLYFQQIHSLQIKADQEQSLATVNTELIALQQQLADEQLHRRSLECAINRFEQVELKSKAYLSQLSQEKEELTNALQKKQQECFALQGKVYSDTALEPSAEEILQFEQLNQQYRMLKHRFEEKSAALDIARRDLFTAEGALHVLQTENKEIQLNLSEEVRILTEDVAQLEKQCEAFEKQIDSLHDFVSLLIPFAKTKI